MSVEEQNYKLEVLEYAVNQCIDRLLPSSSEDALSVILYQCNEVVWRVATEIYTNSRHQVDFVFIRDVLSLRIEPLRNRIAEEERIKAELEAQRLAQELEKYKIIAEQERIRIEQEAEKERLKKIREAVEERLIIEKKAEQEIIKIEQERIKKEKEAKQQKELDEFKKANPNIKINSYKELETLRKIPIKIKHIIIEQLEVEEEQVTLEASFANDLGADELDGIEIFFCN